MTTFGEKQVVYKASWDVANANKLKYIVKYSNTVFINIFICIFYLINMTCEHSIQV